MTCKLFHVFYLFVALFFFFLLTSWMFLFYSPPINTQFPVTVPVVFLVMGIVTISNVYNPFSMTIFLWYMGNDDCFTRYRSVGWSLLSFFIRLSDLKLIKADKTEACGLVTCSFIVWICNKVARHKVRCLKNSTATCWKLSTFAHQTYWKLSLC